MLTWTSSGIIISFPKMVALETSLLTKSIWFFSQIDLPTSNPCAATKVYAIPPPINILSLISVNLSNISIFPAILDPPIIDTNGF